MIKKKTTQTFLLALGTLLLLVSVTASAQAQDFSGEWATVTGQGKVINLSITLRRKIVTGSFNPPSALSKSYRPGDGSTNGFVKASFSTVEPAMQTAGAINGTVEGNVLRFTWQTDSASGAGRFTLSSDGNSFQGTFSRTTNPDDTSGGTWNGTRKHSFAGAWRGKMGEGALESILQQSGYRVTGQLRVNSADLGMIKDGVVTGNTLRFTLVRAGRILPNGARSPDEYVGTGEFVMEVGERSFNGTLLGAAASGTFLGHKNQ